MRPWSVESVKRLRSIWEILGVPNWAFHMSAAPFPWTHSSASWHDESINLLAKPVPMVQHAGYLLVRYRSI